MFLLLPPLENLGGGGSGSASGSSSSSCLGAAGRDFFLRKGRKAALQEAAATVYEHNATITRFCTSCIQICALVHALQPPCPAHLPATSWHVAGHKEVSSSAVGDAGPLFAEQIWSQLALTRLSLCSLVSTRCSVLPCPSCKEKKLELRGYAVFGSLKVIVGRSLTVVMPIEAAADNFELAWGV